MEKNKPIYYIRTLVLIFILVLLTLCYFSFFYSQPSYTISSGLIIILLIITILILSESFDNLSIGKLLSLSRELNKKEKELDVTKNENISLRENIIQLAGSINQNQVNTTITGVTPEILRQALGVKQVTEEEIKEVKAKEEIEEKETIPETPKRIDYLNRAKVFEFALTKFIKTKDLPIDELLREVKFTSTFIGLDPISDRQIRFDGYIPTIQKEYFFETKLKDSITPLLLDRLYIQLSKILTYRKTKEILAELNLIFIEYPEEYASRRTYISIEKIYEYFQPAITNKLLKIETVSLTKEEIENIINQQVQQNA